jgi:hypothetical protein
LPDCILFAQGRAVMQLTRPPTRTNSNLVPTTNKEDGDAKSDEVEDADESTDPDSLEDVVEEKGEAPEEEVGRAAELAKARRSTPKEQRTSFRSGYNNDVLLALVTVFRHADRTPKQKVSNLLRPRTSSLVGEAESQVAFVPALLHARQARGSEGNSDTTAMVSAVSQMKKAKQLDLVTDAVSKVRKEEPEQITTLPPSG